MLRLVGYRLSMTDSTLAIPDDERIEHMILGRKALYDWTGKDFGYDLSSWRRFLMAHKQYGYDHPWAFEGVKKAVLAGIDDKHRNVLVRELHKIEKGAERIAKFGL